MALQHSPSIVTSGLVFCNDVPNPRSYSGSGTALYDISGNGNTGTLTNGPTYTSGISGYLTFDGVDDYVDCGNNSSVQQASAITMAAWVNPTSWSTLGNIMSKNQNSGYRFRLDSTAGALWWYVSGNSIQGGNCPLSTWSYCTVTGSSSGLSAYVNGALVASNATAFAPTTPTSGNLYIGCYAPSSEVFNGKISGTSMYNRALSATEVLQNFNALRGRYNI